MRTALFSLLAGTAVAELEIAAVAEGSWYSKAITFTNTGCDEVNLGDYHIQMFHKGGSSGEWTFNDDLNKNSVYATYKTTSKRVYSHRRWVWNWHRSGYKYYYKNVQVKTQTGTKRHYVKKEFKSWAGTLPSGMSITVCHTRATEKHNQVNADVWKDNCDYFSDEFQVNGNDVTKLYKINSQDGWDEIQSVNEKKDRTGARVLGGQTFDDWKWNGAKDSFPFSQLPGCVEPQLEIAAVSEGTGMTKAITLTNTGCADAKMEYYALKMYYNEEGTDDKWSHVEEQQMNAGSLKSTNYNLPAGTIKSGTSVTICNSQCDPNHTGGHCTFDEACDHYMPSGNGDFMVDGNDLTELKWRFDDSRVDVINEKPDQTCYKKTAGCMSDGIGETNLQTHKSYHWVTKHSTSTKRERYCSWRWRWGCLRYRVRSVVQHHQKRVQEIKKQWVDGAENPHDNCYVCEDHAFPTSKITTEEKCETDPAEKSAHTCTIDECDEWTCAQWCECYRDEDIPHYKDAECFSEDSDETCDPCPELSVE